MYDVQVGSYGESGVAVLSSCVLSSVLVAIPLKCLNLRIKKVRSEQTIFSR